MAPFFLAAMSAATTAPCDCAPRTALFCSSSRPRAVRRIPCRRASSSPASFSSAEALAMALACSLASFSMREISDVSRPAAACASLRPASASCTLVRAASRFSMRSLCSAVATPRADCTSLVCWSQGASSSRTASSSTRIFSTSPLTSSFMASSLASSFSSSLAILAALASSSGASAVYLSLSAAMASLFLTSLAAFSSSFFALAFICLRSSRNFMSLRSNSLKLLLVASSSFWMRSCSFTAASYFPFISPSSLSWDFIFSRSSASCARMPSFCSVSESSLACDSLMQSWNIMPFHFIISASLERYSSASVLAPSRPSRSFSTSFTRFTMLPRFSFISSSCLVPSSIFSTYLLVPMMSSRYSRRPSSWGVRDLGFIMEICSTSPWRMRNRLLSRSIP
mmetsp:Transcript_8816/g.29171  ORF Transcript_8816/g.29171 Transcript_8816/m.29171 type:complete len:397 (+) Transcript_8816:1582-2772(+)